MVVRNFNPQSPVAPQAYTTEPSSPPPLYAEILNSVEVNDAAMAYTATDNPVTRFINYLTQDTNSSPLDKTLLAASAVGLMSFQLPHGTTTAVLQVLGGSAAFVAYLRNRDAGRFRTLAHDVQQHHFHVTDRAFRDGVNCGVQQTHAVAASQNDSLQQQLDAANAEVLEWEKSHQQLTALQQSLQLREQQLQVSAERETLGVEQQWAKLKDTLAEQDRTITALTAQLDEASAVISAQGEQSQAAITEALERQAAHHRAAIAELQARIAELGAARELALQRARLDVELPEIVDQIPSKLGPVIIAGQQGGGKGTQTIALLEKLGKRYGGLNVFVLDPSEDDGWVQSGITPYSADDRPAYFNLMSHVIGGAKKHRLHRNHPGFNRQGVTVFVIDETPSAFDGVSKDTAKKWNSTIRRVNRQGAKYGVFCIFLSQGFQVQSLTSNGIKIMAQDDMMNSSVVLLNDLCEAYTKYNGGCDFREGDRERYETQSGMYRAAIATTNNGARSLSLCKHSSHYGLALSVGSPSRPITPPTLSPYPDWLPVSEVDRYYQEQEALKFLVDNGIGFAEFRNDCETDRETTRNSGETGCETRGETGLKALQDVHPDDSGFACETGETRNSNIGVWLATDEVCREERSLIIGCHGRSLSQKAAVKQVYGKSPGRSETYRRAASKVKQVYGELSQV